MISHVHPMNDVLIFVTSLAIKTEFTAMKPVEELILFGTVLAV